MLWSSQKSVLDLPVEFIKVQTLWKKGRERNIKKILGLLQPFLRASLVLENVSNWKNLIDKACVDEWEEITAEYVSLVGVDFLIVLYPGAKLRPALA